MIEFIVLGKPVPQPRPRVYRTASGKSKAINSSKSATYKRLVKITAKSEMNKRRLILTNNPIAVQLTFVYAIPTSYTKKKRQSVQDGTLRYVKRPDLDNLAKGVLDALNGTIYKDDAQIVTLSINKEYGSTDHVAIKIDDLGGISTQLTN